MDSTIASTTPWDEITDSDNEENNDEAVKAIIAERCQKRKEAAQVHKPPVLPISGPAARGGACYGLSQSVAYLKRSKTYGGYNASTPPSDLFSPKSCPRSRKRQPQTPLRQKMRIEQSEDGSIIFGETFDIWYTDPNNLNGTKKGTDKNTYENAIQKVGEFNTITDFFAFHNAIDWACIQEGGIIAYSRHGVKPQWEDPANERGGRLVIKNFQRSETESIFTKIAIGFFSGMLTDWDNYNLVSLHIRSSARSSDIQLWRKTLEPGLTTHKLRNDIKAFVDAEHLTFNIVPNSESLWRNDSKLGKTARSVKGRKPPESGSSVFDSACWSLSTAPSAENLTTIADHPVHLLYENRKDITHRFVLSVEERKAAAELMAFATPVGIGLQINEEAKDTSGEEDLTSTPSTSSADAKIDTTHTKNVDLPKGKRFGFLKSFLTDSDPTPSKAPYPPWENPETTQTWAKGIQQLARQSTAN